MTRDLFPLVAPEGYAMRNSIKPILALMFIIGGATMHGVEADDVEVRAPDAVVEMYFFGADGKSPKTRLFTFEPGRDGYSLMWNDNKKNLCQQVYYLKTFGGLPSTISVHVINSRFVVYPETLRGSEIPDSTFHEMKAVTHVFDVKRWQMLCSSDPYQYDHDVPLKYSASNILSQALWEDRKEDKYK